MKLLPAFTMIVPNSWPEKVKEIDALNITELALFPTTLDFTQRQELYRNLEKTNLQKITFVHLREEDMDEKEVDYLSERWGAEIFNIHPLNTVPLENFLTKYRDRIYVENIWGLPETALKGFAGICMDFSHLENTRLTHPADYDETMLVAKKYKIGCAHISSIYNAGENICWRGLEKWPERVDYHYADSPRRFDYLKNYSREMFPEIAAIEVENSLAEQLKFRDYIHDLLK